MTDLDRLEQRLSAVERTVVDGESALDEIPELAALGADLDRLETQLEGHETRLATLEGRTESIEGYVGRIDAVNDAVETEATTALAVVDRLERRVADLERRLEDVSASAPADAGETADPTDEESDCEPTTGDRTDDRIERTIADVVGETSDGTEQQIPTTGGPSSGDDPLRSASDERRPESRCSTDATEQPVGGDRRRTDGVDGDDGRPEPSTRTTDQRTVARRVSSAEGGDTAPADARGRQPNCDETSSGFVPSILSWVR
ncbi:DUF7310 family coiled-coil domain-containing protein [Natrialba swarupiae]|uniref:DUF7310 domain-containing protein n=1 Tax=Natrialba swarupiae TaxID=2448032 RepID=A0A5D5AM03_9EURY|nr:hypothetical protein [Natrialba swarupiae]TYT62746.1 hypothetical protein FYC77_06865 [Natrialba swarupiae]